MPDIAMCQNTDCKKRHKCYRFMAIPLPMQCYLSFLDMPCKYFMQIKGRPIKKEKGPEITPEP